MIGLSDDLLLAGCPEYDEVYGDPQDHGHAPEVVADSVAGDGQRSKPVSTNETALGEAWEDPMALPAYRATVPWPSGVLGPAVSDFVQAVATETATPPDLAAMAALGTVSTVIAGAVVISPQPGWEEPVNLYLLGFAAPGEGKTPAFSRVTRPLQTIEEVRQKSARPEIAAESARRKMADARLRRLTDAAAREDDAAERGAIEEAAVDAARAADDIAVPSLPRLYTREATPEGLRRRLAEQGGRLGVLTDEGAEFFELSSRYATTGKGNVGVYLAGHDGQRYTYDRAGQDEPTVIPRTTLTVCLMAQPVVLGQMAGDQQARGRGLYARFLLAIPTSLVGHRPIHRDPVPPEVASRWEKLVAALAEEAQEHHDEPAVLGLSAGAKRVWDRWRTEHEPRLRPDVGDLAWIADAANKLPGQALRLAGVLHAMRTGGIEGTISEATMTAAIESGRYYLDHALVAYARMGADPGMEDAASLLRWLRARRPAEVSVRQVSRSRDWDSGRVRAALDVLARYGWVRHEAPAAGPGRPTESYTVHAAICQTEPDETPSLPANCRDLSGSLPQRTRGDAAPPPTDADLERWDADGDEEWCA